MSLRKQFTTPYDQYKYREGQPFTTLRKITKRNATQAELREYDREVLPMYRIQFDDGVVISAWPEEVETIAPQKEG